jgi:hypothetical protein
MNLTDTFFVHFEALEDPREDNHIGDEGAKAFASNATLLRHDVSYNPPIGDEGAKALAETNPVKRATYGRKVGLQTEVPSLRRQSLFFLVLDKNATLSCQGSSF